MSIQTGLNFVAKHLVDVADEEPCLPNHVLIASDAGDNEEHAQLTDELIADLTDTCINIGNVAKSRAPLDMISHQTFESATMKCRRWQTTTS